MTVGWGLAGPKRRVPLVECMTGSQLAYGTRGAARERGGVRIPVPHTVDSILLKAAVFALDIACVFVAAAIASYLTAPALDHLWARFLAHLTYPVLFAVTWTGASLHEQLFTSIRKQGIGYLWLSISKAVVLSLVFSGFAAALVTGHMAEPAFVINFGLASLILISLLRGVVSVVLWSIHKRGFHARHIVIVGANPRTRRLVETIQAHKRFGYQLVGLIESDPARAETMKALGVPHLGDLDELERVLTERVVDEVHVCLPVRSCYESIQSIAHLCVGVGVPVRLVADLFPLRLATSRVYNLADIPMLSLSTIPESSLWLGVKRAIDVAASAAGLILLSPLLLVTAVLIKLDSKGPVLYAQERVGMNQRRFRMLKFRSMVADAEQKKAGLKHLNEAEGPVFKIRNDPRVTRVGRFIRKFSIDELPQLFNVLKGEMSLVGPRPPLPDEVARYTWDQRRRLSVKPGVTGLWQVSGRSEVSFVEWVDMDLSYIDHWSLWNDFVILFRTVGAVFTGRGAA